MSKAKRKAPKFRVLDAAKMMDWQQVVLNGGPPCFHLEDDGRFCGRAERWDGHKKRKTMWIHKFVSLYDLIRRERGDA